MRDRAVGLEDSSNASKSEVSRASKSLARTAYVANIHGVQHWIMVKLLIKLQLRTIGESYLLR